MVACNAAFCVNHGATLTREYGAVVKCSARTPVVAKARSGRKPAKKFDPADPNRPKGFGPGPSATPENPKRSSSSRIEITPPVDKRPLVDVPIDFVPRGPTLRESYIERGLMEPEVGPDAGVLPQIVADRMIRRIAGFAGVPLGVLILFFVGYFVAKYQYDVSVLPAFVATTTLGCIGLAGIGITYGIMSSSWDEDDEGSALGFKEARKNVTRARDGLSTMLNKERREDERVKNMKEVNEWRSNQSQNDRK